MYRYKNTINYKMNKLLNAAIYHFGDDQFPIEYH